MATTKEILRQRVRERLDVTGKKAHAVSREMGVNGGYVRDILDPAKSSMPSGDKLDLLAAALETTTDYLLGKVKSPETVRSEVTLSEMRNEWRGPDRGEQGIPLVGTGDCADLEVDVDGHQVLIERSSFDPEYTVSYIARPPALSGDRSAYAIYFHGSSMEPRFYAGEVGIVQPTRPAGPGDFVVVQLTNGEGNEVISVLVKRLLRMGSDYVELEQFNPPLTFRLSRRKVARVHRIVPPTDLLFR